MELSKPTKLDLEWPKTLSHHPTSSAYLLSLTQICFVFVSCVQRRVVEGSQLGSGGCVVHVDVHGEWVMLWVAVATLSMADRVCLPVTMQKLWSAWAVLDLYGMFMLCCEILLPLCKHHSYLQTRTITKNCTHFTANQSIKTVILCFFVHLHRNRYKL